MRRPFCVDHDAGLDMCSLLVFPRLCVAATKRGVVMADITWKSILTKLVQGNHLTAEESEWFVEDRKSVV